MTSSNNNKPASKANASCTNVATNSQTAVVNSGPFWVPAYYFGPGDAVVYDANENTNKKHEVSIAKHPKAKKIELPDGSYAMDCARCDNRLQWAEANQQDGTFICYGCRNGF
jgi:hypothetical protein